MYKLTNFYIDSIIIHDAEVVCNLINDDHIQWYLSSIYIKISCLCVISVMPDYIF